MSYIKIFLFGLMLCALGITGCSSSSVSSGFGSGSGYSINLTASNSQIPQGGGTSLIAAVRDAQGNPVTDSTIGVTFTSSIGATIVAQNQVSGSTTSGYPTGGIASATYTAPTVAILTTLPPSVTDQVTASYRGAFATVSIHVYKP